MQFWEVLPMNGYCCHYGKHNNNSNQHFIYWETEKCPAWARGRVYGWDTISLAKWLLAKKCSRLRSHLFIPKPDPSYGVCSVITLHTPSTGSSGWHIWHHALGNACCQKASTDVSRPVTSKLGSLQSHYQGHWPWQWTHQWRKGNFYHYTCKERWLPKFCFCPFLRHDNLMHFTVFIVGNSTQIKWWTVENSWSILRCW